MLHSTSGAAIKTTPKSVASGEETTVSGGLTVCLEDRARAEAYRLLSGFLARSPTPDHLLFAATLPGDETEFGAAIGNFAHIASLSAVDAVDQEFHTLFIGIGRGELLPYGSYYLTGFLNEKPLARLRSKMIEIGIERDPSVKEPEDHIAAVCDMMASMILGDHAPAADINTQREFFNDHVRNWALFFFRDLEGAKASVLYAALGRVGRIFIEIETTAFSMD